jgi:hypothetical protein
LRSTRRFRFLAFRFTFCSAGGRTPVPIVNLLFSAFFCFSDLFGVQIFCFHLLSSGFPTIHQWPRKFLCFDWKSPEISGNPRSAPQYFFKLKGWTKLDEAGRPSGGPLTHNDLRALVQASACALVAVRKQCPSGRTLAALISLD